MGLGSAAVVLAYDKAFGGVICLLVGSNNVQAEVLIPKYTLVDLIMIT